MIMSDYEICISHAIFGDATYIYSKSLTVLAGTVYCIFWFSAWNLDPTRGIKHLDLDKVGNDDRLLTTGNTSLTDRYTIRLYFESIEKRKLLSAAQ